MGNWMSNSVSIGSNTIIGNISKVDRVVISNSIGVRVGGGLSKVRLGISTNGMVGNDWRMVDNRRMGNSNWVSNTMSKSMTDRVGHSMGNSMSKSMSNRVSHTMANSMSKAMSNWMTNDTSSSMKTVWRVSHSSNTGSKSL